TVALISEEMDISLDGIVFHDRAPQTVAKCVLDYFAGKSEEESQRYIDLCMSADKLK
ncbi:XRE family transcriptional regulator, partial [Soehngenia saccharolytica]